MHTHACMHTQTHTHTRVHIHTHTHTHTLTHTPAHLHAQREDRRDGDLTLTLALCCNYSPVGHVFVLVKLQTLVSSIHSPTTAITIGYVVGFSQTDS